MKLLLFITLILQFVVFISAKSKSLKGDKILVVFDNLEDQSSYSIFLNSLKERGYDLTFKSASDENLEIIKYEESLYDHVILLAPETDNYENDITAKQIIDFIDMGGNLLVAANEKTGTTIQELIYEFGTIVDEPKFTAIDNFKHNGTTPDVLAIEKMANPIFIDELQAPLLYSGTSIKSNGKNPYNKPVVVGGPASYSWDFTQVTKNPMVTGSDLILVNSLQAINNARIVLTGSLKMFTNDFISSTVQIKDKKFKRSGNLDFITAMTKWTFHETKVLKIISSKHHKFNEVERPEYYTIKDKIHYEIEIAQYDNGMWRPFNASDVQLELVMLDPYIRITLQQQPITNPNSSTFAIDLVVPDHCGVFTFKVDYRRYGYSWIKDTDVIAIHPVHYNEFPRFLTQGLPYYCGAFSMIAGFFLLTIVSLYHEDDDKKKKNNLKKTN